jgi:hypothetical protein
LLVVEVVEQIVHQALLEAVVEVQEAIVHQVLGQVL